MNSTKIVPTFRRPLFLAAAILLLNAGSALAADLPYDAQAQIQEVLSGTSHSQSTTRVEVPGVAESAEALVRRFILGAPSTGARPHEAAALNSSTIDRRAYADARQQIQRTLQGGTG